MVGEMRFSKVYNGRGLSVCQGVKVIEVTVVVYSDVMVGGPARRRLVRQTAKVVLG